MTGIGDVSSPPPTGASAKASPLSSANLLPALTVGGAPAQVFFAGLTPGFVGLAQINLQLPDALPAGNALDLIISFDQASSRPVMLPTTGQ